MTDTDRRFSLATAFAASEMDDLATWVGEFLASKGSDNAALAAGLAQDPHWWLGPLQVPLPDLVRLAGPEDDVLVPIEEDEWEDDVATMADSLDEGWEPPPLLAEFQDGRLLLQDGNHRYEALTRADAADAWVLVWFDSEAERAEFAAAVAVLDD